MSQVELTPEVFTADAVGEPGERAFYLQATGTFGAYTFIVEKQQVSLLAEKLRELLVLVDSADAVGSTMPARDPGLGLEDPLEPLWRVGTIGLAYDEDRDVVVVFVQPVTEENEDEADPDEDDEDEDGVRLLLRRDQARAFVLHALAVIGEGREICQLCGLPMDPAGHKCPASNGHQLTS